MQRVTQAYLASINDPFQLPKLEQLLATVPQPLRDVIANPKEVLEPKQELDQKLTHAPASMIVIVDFSVGSLGWNCRLQST